MGDTCSKTQYVPEISNHPTPYLSIEEYSNYTIEEKIKKIGPLDCILLDDEVVQSKLNNQNLEIKKLFENNSLKKSMLQSYENIQETRFPLPYVQLNESGDMYKGQWNNREMDGWGELSFANGDYFCGILSSGKLEKGILIYHNGDYYEGTFQNNQLYEGTYYSKENDITFNGSQKENQEKSGTYNQIGVFKYDIGRKLTIDNVMEYEGSFQNNEFHGKGTINFIDGTKRKYTGYFKNNKKEGKNCVFEWPLQLAKYRGGYLNDKKHGKGKMEFFSDVIYDGEFKDGKMNQINAKLLIQKEKFTVTFQEGVLISCEPEIDEVIKGLFNMDNYDEQYSH